MVGDEPSLPHDAQAGQRGIAGDSAPPSTLPASDTHATGDRLSQRSADFGLVFDRAEAGPDPLIGIDLGGVRIERPIGEGGMGRVYEAQQTHPARTVAVKVMRTSSHGVAAQQRFRREADALARLRHPGIAQIFTAGCHRIGIVDVPYYVMEFIPGAESLVQACDRRGLPLRSRLELLLAVCDAVAHGHAEGIVHRDLKPGNILVDAAGKPKIIDFGIARMDGAEAHGDGPRTETGQFVGTRPYMAPEQFMEHRASIDARTDVYAIGVVMQESRSWRPRESFRRPGLPVSRSRECRRRTVGSPVVPMRSQRSACSRILRPGMDQPPPWPLTCVICWRASRSPPRRPTPDCRECSREATRGPDAILLHCLQRRGCVLRSWG
jgi:serine/threonine protein kinase